MSQKKSPFEGAKSFTVKQFASEKKFNKIQFLKVVTSKENGNKPVYYKNADGTPTSIQKIAILDEASNRQAMLSKECAAARASGKDIFAKDAEYPLKFQEYFYDRHDPATGNTEEDVKGVVLMYNKPNSSFVEEVVDIFGLND